jgi:hemolysin III
MRQLHPLLLDRRKRTAALVGARSLGDVTSAPSVEPETSHLTAASVAALVKPRLRGWLHLGAAPLALVAAIVLVCLSRGAAEIASSSIYAISAVLLFTVSAIYHRGRWSPPVLAALKRFDHANIFLIIAGTYTPFAVLLLEGGARTALLAIVWTGAALGIGFRVFWVGAPRWLYVPAYLALGWVAVVYLPQFTTTGGVAVLVLLGAGGLLYTAGGIVYGTKRPNPSPTWFGFHEVFHSLTVLAFVLQYIAISIVTYTH